MTEDHHTRSTISSFNMNSFIVFSCILATALALPFEDIAEVYLTEDTAGNYKLSFKSKAISREEKRTDDGNVVGDFTYVDPEGVEHKLSFVSGPEKGFVPASADLPVTVPEGVELVEARNQHLAAVAEDQAKYPNGAPTEKPVDLSEVLAKLVVPEIASLPVEAVPAEEAELGEAKAALLAEYASVLRRLAEEYKNTQAA